MNSLNSETEHKYQGGTTVYFAAGLTSDVQSCSSVTRSDNLQAMASHCLSINRLSLELLLFWPGSFSLAAFPLGSLKALTRKSFQRFGALISTGVAMFIGPIGRLEFLQIGRKENADNGLQALPAMAASGQGMTFYMV